MLKLTSLKRELIRRTPSRHAGGVVFVMLLTLVAVNLARPAQTAAATSSYLNFQARLEAPSGAVVADGNYNVEFNLYSASSGGSSLWTEDYLVGTSTSVNVVNGYLTVNLGSQTAFPTNINWDQQLWITMNIGGTSGSVVPTATSTTGWDGEMSPRLQLTSVPYAFRAGQLALQTGANTSTLGWATQTGANSLLLPNRGGTLCVETDTTGCGFAASSGSTSYIQNTSSVQSSSNFNISGNGTIGTNLAVTGTSTLTGALTANGTTNLQNTTNSATAFQVQSAAGSDNTDSLLAVSTVYNAGNLVTNGSFEQAALTGWAAKGNMAISQVSGVSAPYGSNAMQITNSGTPVALNGAKFPVTMVNGTVYALSFYARSTGSTFATLSFGRADNGATDTACVSTGSTSLTAWLRFACTFTAGAQSGTPYIFIGQNDTTARTWYVDGVSFEAVATGTYYKEGTLNLNGLALGNTLIQPAANSNQAFTVANNTGNTGLNIDTNGGTLTTNFAASVNNTGLFSATSTAEFQVRNSTTAAPVFKLDTSTINNSDTNGGFENTTTGYAVNHAGTTLTADATANNAYGGANTGKIVATTSTIANSGFKYTLSTATMATATSYTISFYAKLASGQAAFTTLTAGRAENGATETACTLNSTTLTTYWQRYSCTFTTGTTSGTPYIYFGQTDAGVAHTYFLDDIQYITAGAPTSNYHEGNLQLNGVINSPTIFQPQSDSSNNFQVQDANGASELTVDTTTNNLLVNSGFETGTVNWAAKGTTSTFANDSTPANVYHGTQSLKAIVTAATSGMSTAAGQAAFTTNIAINTQYQMTFYAKCDSSYNTLTYGRQDVAGTDVNSVTNGSCTTNWQQYTAHWTTGGTVTNPDIYVDLGSTTAGTVWIDAVSLVQTVTNAATNYGIGNILVGGILTNPTIFENNANSTTAFQVQNASASTVFNVDTTNSRVGIGTNAPGNLLSVGALTTASSTSQVAVSTGGTSNSGIIIQTVASQSSGYFLQAQNSGGSILASIDYLGNLVVQNATINGHLTTANSSGSTTAAVNANAGTGGSPACTIAGNDTGGQITLTTGTSAWAAAVQCTITFAQSYATNPPHPVITPANNTDTSAVKPYVDVPGSTPFTTFTLNFISADTAQHTFKFNFFNAQ